jgi:hypothetical protein
LTFGSETLTTTFPDTCTIVISPKKSRAKSKRTVVVVYMESDNTEETTVEQQEANTTALTNPQYTKNKTDVVSVIERSEEVNVQRQKLKATTLETHDTTTQNTHAESKRIGVKIKTAPNKKVADSESKKIAVTVFI